MSCKPARKHPIFCKFLIIAFLLPNIGLGAEEYFGRDVLAARLVLAKLISTDIIQLKTESEQKAWAKTLLAAVALDRLEGEDAAAVAKLQYCGAWCGKFGLANEWRTEIAWACTKKKETIFCLPENIKAQKSPH